MHILIILILLICKPSLGLAYLQEQDMEALATRSLAPKKKIYPVLDQFEQMLYPGKKFSRETPSSRLERIEIAVFGAKQQGSIGIRINQLKNEIEAWEIANAQSMTLAQYKPGRATKQPQQVPQSIAQYPNYQQPINYPSVNRAKKKIDYDYMNYRMFSPLVQTLGRKGIQNAFDRRD